MSAHRGVATPDGRFQILALDGGGLRGMFSAAALAWLEDDFGTSIIDHFDLITGTSTGGLVALGLAAGLSAQDIVDFYRTMGDQVFPRSRLRRLRRVRKPLPPKPLHTALQEVLGSRTLGDSPVRLAIPSFSLTSNKVYLFRTPHLPRLRRDHRESMVDVALATTAAPTYLPAHPLGGLRLVDGGVWANNPTMVGVVEAIASCRISPGSVHVLNVGTTTAIRYRPKRLDNGSPLWWGLEAFDVLLRGQALAATNHAGLLLGPDHVRRLDVPVKHGLHRMTSVNEEHLIGNAQAASREMSPSLGVFFDHMAVSYRNYGRSNDG